MVLNYVNKNERPCSNGKEAKVWHLYVGDVETRLSNYKQTLLKILKDCGAKVVCDAACGIGIDSVMLLEEGYEVVSCDADRTFLRKTREMRQKRPDLADWQIGFGDWLDLKSAKVQHPAEGYDAIICIGNSFTTLPDFEGGNRTHLKALQNFKDLLKEGGVLVIDHRNFEYTLAHKKFAPSSQECIYYNSGRVFNVRADLVEEGDKVTQVIFKSDMDVSGSELADGPDIKWKSRDGVMVPALKMNDIACYPHTVEGFTALLKNVFGREADHRVLPDFKENGSKNLEPMFWVHIIIKSKVGSHL